MSLAAGLDGGNTIIFAKGENVTNPIIHPIKVLSAFAEAFLFGDRDGQHDFVLRFPPLRYGGDAGQLDFRQRLA